MRLLHVGTGFRPYRRGGLVAYVDDLIDAQRARGDDVAYFFSGRHYPHARGPRLKRWERAGVPMLEIVDSPLHHHGHQPELELSEPRVERLFDDVLDQLAPDVVHVHELAGLPSSLLDATRRAGVPTVVTLQDYFPVCSTFKLLDAAGQVCTRMEIGADCAANLAADRTPADLLIEATLRHQLSHTRLRRLEQTRYRYPIYDRLARWSRREAERRARPPSPPAAFQRRREVNVARLNGADSVIAMSHRVAEIYERLGVEAARMRTIHLTLAHIAKLTPRPGPVGSPVTFATLAGFESPAKGAHLLVDAMRRLAGRDVRLLVFGQVDPAVRTAAAELPGIELRGTFAPADLDRMLDEVDVGLVPSIWEEAYGYVGVEFLAKAIPVVANAIGGMPDYVIPGRTGWLNGSCTASELAEIMGGIADDPSQVTALYERLRAQRPAVVKPMEAHAEEMAAVYAEVAGG
jgi:glycosyltransferase involved in cell wall biosynthesis